MASLSTDDRTTVQMYLGISDDEAVFTNDELDTLYTRAGSDVNRTVLEGLRVLLVNNSKLFDYSVGSRSVKRSQIFAHLKDMLTYWETKVEQEADQVLFVSTRPVPPRDKDEPNRDKSRSKLVRYK